MWKAWKRSVDFSTLTTAGRRRTVERVEKSQIFPPFPQQPTGNGASRNYYYFSFGKERKMEGTMQHDGP